MFRAVWEWLTARFGSEDGAVDEEAEQSRFIPSPLDISVRFAHGGSSTDVEREIAAIERQARHLEDHQHDE